MCPSEYDVRRNRRWPDRNAAEVIAEYLRDRDRHEETDADREREAAERARYERGE